MSAASVSLLSEKVATLRIRYDQLNGLGTGQSASMAPGVAPGSPVNNPVRQIGGGGGGVNNLAAIASGPLPLPRGSDIRIQSGLPAPNELLATNASVVAAPPAGGHAVQRPTVPPREVILVQPPSQISTRNDYSKAVEGGGGLSGGAGNAAGSGGAHLYAPQTEMEVSNLQQQHHLSPTTRANNTTNTAGVGVGIQREEVPVVHEHDQQKASTLRSAEESEILRKLIADETMRKHGFIVSDREGAPLTLNNNSNSNGLAGTERYRLQEAGGAAVSSPIERPREQNAIVGEPTPYHTADSVFISPEKTSAPLQTGGGGVATAAAAAPVTASTAAGVPYVPMIQLDRNRPTPRPQSQHVYGAAPVPHVITTAAAGSVEEPMASGQTNGRSRPIMLRSEKRAADRAASALAKKGAITGGSQPRPSSARPNATKRPSTATTTKQRQQIVFSSGELPAAAQTHDYDIDELCAHPTASIGLKEQNSLIDVAQDAYTSIMRNKHGRSELVKKFPNIISKPRSETDFPQVASIEGVMQRLSDHVMSLQRRNGFQSTAAPGVVVSGEDGETNSRARKLTVGRNGTRRTRGDGSQIPKRRGHTTAQIEAWGEGVGSREAAIAAL